MFYLNSFRGKYGLSWVAWFCHLLGCIATLDSAEVWGAHLNEPQRLPRAGKKREEFVRRRADRQQGRGTCLSDPP
jgi:hypothetical protein